MWVALDINCGVLSEGLRVSKAATDFSDLVDDVLQFVSQLPCRLAFLQHTFATRIGSFPRPAGVSALRGGSCQPYQVDELIAHLLKIGRRLLDLVNSP